LVPALWASIPNGCAIAGWALASTGAIALLVAPVAVIASLAADAADCASACASADRPAGIGPGPGGGVDASSGGCGCKEKGAGVGAGGGDGIDGVVPGFVGDMEPVDVSVTPALSSSAPAPCTGPCSAAGRPVGAAGGGGMTSSGMAGGGGMASSGMASSGMASSGMVPIGTAAPSPATDSTSGTTGFIFMPLTPYIDDGPFLRVRTREAFYPNSGSRTGLCLRVAITLPGLSPCRREGFGLARCRALRSGPVHRGFLRGSLG
jgi:hypothetical protein